MADKMTASEIENLANQVANLVTEQLEVSLGTGRGRGPVGLCGPKFSSCGSYTCIPGFTCQATAFTCTGTFKDQVIGRAEPER
jgi:hypothetical protein